MVCLFLAGLVRPLGTWAAGRSSDGLVVLYDFRLAKGDIVRDHSGAGQPLNLKIENPKNVRRSEGALEVRGPTLVRSDKRADKVFKAVDQQRCRLPGRSSLPGSCVGPEGG